MNKMKTIRRQGTLVVLFALVLPVLVVILGFTIDYANIQRVRNEIRAIADLSAKAAASKLASTHDTNAAIAAAQAVANANFVNGQPLNLEASDIVFGNSRKLADGSFQFDPGTGPFNSVQINAERMTDEGNGVNLFFGSLYGRDDISLSHVAVAAFKDVDIILVLDRSGSMKWKTVGNMTPAELADIACKKPNPNSRWRSLDDSIQVFLNTLRLSGLRERVGMATFASNLTNFCSGISTTESSLDQPLTYDLQQIEDAMETYNQSVWDGATNIYAGLHEGRLHMQANQTPGADHVIILLTDGVYNTGPAPFDEATLCKASGITVHTITFSDQANQADMKTVAANGGGKHYHADDEAELKRAFEQIGGSFAILTQ